MRVLRLLADAKPVGTGQDRTDRAASTLQSEGRVWGRGHVFIPRAASSRLATAALGGGSVAVVSALTVSVVHSSVRLYLPPDGAHYIADADALLGSGVRPLRHPPLFPALVAAARLVAGDIGAFQVAMIVSQLLLGLSLFLLLRRWTSRGPSLIGAVSSLLFPTMGELWGWGGGATLLGAAGFVLVLLAMEAWTRGRRSGGLLVGGALGLVGLTHPFLLGMGLACVGARWLDLAAQRRRFGLGWDPLGLRGMASVLVPMVPAVVVAAPFYLDGAGQFQLQVPRPEGLTQLLGWALGHDALAWGLLAVGVLGPIVSRARGPFVYAFTILGLSLVLATTVRADASYISRIAYLWPVVVGIGVAVAGERLRRPMLDLARRWARPRTLTTLASVLLLGTLGLGSYAPRLQRAASFYEYLDPSDARALEALRGEPGVVATSWRASDYGSGVSMSWFVEGLSKRRAFGPTAPWLSTVPQQQRVGGEMQQLFAGIRGIQDGAVQLAAGTPGMRADPSVQVLSGGFYFPILYANSLVDDYPVGIGGGGVPSVLGPTLFWQRQDDSGRPALREWATLDGRQVTLSYAVAGSQPSGPFTIWFWPAYGVHWKEVQQGDGVVQALVGLPNEDVGFRLSARGAEVTYVPTEARFGVEAIVVHSPDATGLTVTIQVDASAVPGPLSSFEEGQLVSANDLTEVVVWKDTGWSDRFDRDPCYVPDGDSPRLLFYRIVPQGCASGGPSP